MVSLCNCCGRNMPLNKNAYLYPEQQYGQGLCELCINLPPILRQAIATIKWHIVMHYLEDHREDICTALFARIGSTPEQQPGAADEKQA